MKNLLLACFLVAFASSTSFSDDDTLTLKSRTVNQAGETINTTKNWETKKTAVIVCDMWDLHHCRNAVGRVNEMAPRMNRFLKTLRADGATVVHAPSSCVGFYKDHPARKNIGSIPKSKSIPNGIGKWCDHIAAEKDYPLDQSDGGEDDDPTEHKNWAAKLKSMGKNPRAPWTRQVATIEIKDQDFITDNGEEVWSILESKGIDNVMLVGVHTNMCVLGRPFGLRQLSKNGKNVVLVRDLTDAMYNPARWPFVDHFQGNDLIQRHVERYVCPTITSDQVLGGTPFRFKNDKPKKCLIVSAESLYETETTLPVFAKAVLESQLGIETKMLTAKKGEQSIDGLESEIKDSDLVILSVRRRSLPKSQLDAIKKHLASGKPLVAIRTSSHAFDTRGKHPDGHAEWPNFDKKVLGCAYTGHYANELKCSVLAASDHPILTDVKLTSSDGSLYQSSPLASSATPILFGKVADHKPEPIAWTHQNGNSKIFYTSLGHKSDFANAGFVKLLENGVRWSLEMKIGAEPARKK